jgi:hypothetical protein
MMDKRLLKYIAIDNSPQKVFDARAKDLPVYFGDIERPGNFSTSFPVVLSLSAVLTPRPPSNYPCPRPHDEVSRREREGDRAHY